MSEILDPTSDVPGIVDYERPDTWPRTLTALFDAHSETLESHGREQHRISMLSSEEGQWARNRYKDQHDHIAQRANEILGDERLLGFHCTRLANDEIADVRARGLHLPSADFLHERICRRIETGDIPESLGTQLLDKHQAGDQSRQGCLCYVNMRSVLKSKGAVGRLFRSWGGEALYNSHEADIETGPLLRRIGTPCIWIVVLPIGQGAVTWRNVGERFVRAYLAHRGAATGNGANIETRLFEPLPPDSIINVVRYDDPAFEKLTGRSTWREPIMPSVEAGQGES
ncbi:MAG: hypothetical protein IID32_12920 [Planctomycetes bacterium]|nr:hypothetical protein [Planctomycetota bacterium]